MEFRLTIKVGNAAMLTGTDIANAMREQATNVEFYMPNMLRVGVTGLIDDENGNTVGNWQVLDGK